MISLIIGSITTFNIAIGKDLTTSSTLGCILLPYLLRLSVHLCSWIQVLVTYDRLIYLAYPRRMTFLKRKPNILLIILLLTLALALLNLEHVWFSVHETTRTSATQLISNNNNNASHVRTRNVTVVTCTSSHLVVTIRDVIAIMLRGVLPFILIMIGNSLLARALFKSKRRAHSISRRSSMKSRRERNFALSIFIMDILFVIFLIPMLVTIVISNLHMFIGVSEPMRAAAYLAYMMSIYFSGLTLASPFLVNLIFNKIFRAELVNFLSHAPFIRLLRN